MNWLKINLNWGTRMKQQPTDHTKYSKEVEEILRKKPAFLVRKGILLLTILVALLLVVSHFIKYPEKLTASVTFEATTKNVSAPINHSAALINDSALMYGQIILTSAAASIVEPGQPVLMFLQATPESLPIEVKGTVDSLLPMGNGDYYTVLVIPAEPIQLFGYQGKAYISIGEASLLSKILNPVFAVFRSAGQ